MLAQKASVQSGRAKHVLIDGYFLGKPYGFGRFIFELCRALGRVRRALNITVAVPAKTSLNDLPNYPGLQWQHMPNANFILWEQILIPKLARRLRCDVIHFPYNTRAVFTGGARSVTTVHDLLFLSGSVPVTNLKAYIAEKYSTFAFWTATVRSNALVSVSNTTHASLAALGRESTIVHNTVDGFIENAKSAVNAGERRFFLHRGGELPHRNTRRVIAAFHQVQYELPQVTLKIIGASNAAALCEAEMDPAIEFLPRLSDAELCKLYSGAAAVIATSLKEGFGLPIIEAFGFDAPVITSNIDPMREIASDAAILVDPYSTNEIASAMLSVVKDPLYASALVAKGRSRLEDFSSTRIAHQMLNVYDGVT